MKAAPFAATLVSTGSILAARYELRVDLPLAVDAPVQLFLLSLVCNRSYR